MRRLIHWFRMQCKQKYKRVPYQMQKDLRKLRSLLKAAGGDGQLFLDEQYMRMSALVGDGSEVHEVSVDPWGCAQGLIGQLEREQEVARTRS